MTAAAADNEEVVKVTSFICEEAVLPEPQVAELQVIEEEIEK